MIPRDRKYTIKFSSKSIIHTEHLPAVLLNLRIVVDGETATEVNQFQPLLQSGSSSAFHDQLLSVPKIDMLLRCGSLVLVVCRSLYKSTSQFL